jgi:hypothetical protein
MAQAQASRGYSCQGVWAYLALSSLLHGPVEGFNLSKHFTPRYERFFLLLLTG